MEVKRSCILKITGSGFIDERMITLLLSFKYKGEGNRRKWKKQKMAYKNHCMRQPYWEVFRCSIRLLFDMPKSSSYRHVRRTILLVNRVDTALLLTHGSMKVEIHGRADRRMSQNGRYRLAVHTIFQAGRGKSMAHGVKIAVLHFAAPQDCLELLLNITWFRTGIFTCKQI